MTFTSRLRFTQKVRAQSFSIVTCLLPCLAAPAHCAQNNVERIRSSAHAVSLRGFFRTVSMSGVTISPDGKFVSVRTQRRSLSNNLVRLRWYIIRLTDGKVVAQTDGGAPDWNEGGYVFSGNPQWSSNSQWLYFRELRQGRLSLWRLGRDGSAERVISGPSDIDGFVLGNMKGKVYYWIGPSREKLILAKQREFRTGVVLNGTQLLSGALENNVPYRSGFTTMRVGHDDRWSPLGDNGKRVRMVYDLKTGESRAAAQVRYRYDEQDDSIMPLREVIGVGSVMSSARSALTGDVAFIKYKRTDTRDAYGRISSHFMLGLKRGQDIVLCQKARCRDLTGQVVWRPGTNEFLFTTSTEIWHGKKVMYSVQNIHDDIVSMYSWNEKTLNVRLRFRTVGKIGPNMTRYASSAQCPVTMTYAVCVLERPIEPPSLVKIGLNNGKVAALFVPNSRLQKEILATGVESHERYMIWKDNRGLRHAGIFLAAGRGRRGGVAPPLVITSESCDGFLHGGSGLTAPEIILWEDGFAVLCVMPNGVRAARNYRIGYIPPGKSKMMEYIYDAYRSAVALLSKEGLVDSRHVGISGISFAANVVNWIVTHHPHFAAVATAGHLNVNDPIDYYIMGGMGSLGASLIRGSGILDPRTRKGAQYFRAVSDALNAGRICSPILIQTDEQEFTWGIQYYGALRLDGAPAEVIVFPGESHNFWEPRHLFLVERRNIDWFRFWLQDYEAADSGRRARYARWQRLRRRRNVCEEGGRDTRGTVNEHYADY